jgi:hypothetical protein
MLIILPFFTLKIMEQIDVQRYISVEDCMTPSGGTGMNRIPAKRAAPVSPREFREEAGAA